MYSHRRQIFIDNKVKWKSIEIVGVNIVNNYYN